MNITSLCEWTTDIMMLSREIFDERKRKGKTLKKERSCRSCIERVYVYRFNEGTSSRTSTSPISGKDSNDEKQNRILMRVG